MIKSLSKKSKKVIEERLEEFKERGFSLGDIVRIGARMMLQVAVEEEVTAFLEKDYYGRGGRGNRNGYKPRVIKVGHGDIRIDMPQARGAGVPFHSRILPPRATHADEVMEVIPLLYMNGIATRKVKKAIGKLLGKKGLSHQNIVRITNKVVEEFNSWKKRDLSELKVVYLILDGTRLAVRANTKEKEAVLVAWAFLEDGRLELLSVSLGNQESYSAWKGFLEDMIKRGLNEPLLITIDGCPGLIKAVKEIFPSSDIQRCTRHRMENVLNKVLKEDRNAVKDSLRKIFYASTYEHAKEAIELFKRNWGKRYPSAVEILTDGIEDCLTYYKYPYQHWRRIRTTNIVERSFGEVKRRTKGIGRFKDEQRALMMVYWQLKELRWNGISMTNEARMILAGIRTSRLQRVA